MKTPTVRMHLWLESGESVYFGMGRVMLLDMIEQHGSLRKASEAMGMSYRAAWGRMKQTETVIGEPLVERSGPKKGFRLTPLGHDIVQLFRTWHKEVEDYAVSRARAIFPWSTEPFSEGKPPVSSTG